MLSFLYFLAALDTSDQPALEGEVSKLFGYNMRDAVLLGSMVLLLAIALFLFAYVTRKNRRATIGLAGSRAIYRAEEKDEDDSDHRRYRKKRRRRNHPEFLPRNPTLQETGGLPPPRPDEPAEPTQ